MIPIIRIRTNEASYAQIAHHLARANKQFVPLLSSRVDIEAYAHKIFDNTYRMEAWDSTELVGLVATYCNDSERMIAYITNVSVFTDWAGKGLGSDLLQRTVLHMQSIGLAQIRLEVDRNNVTAMRLYERAGFCECDVNGSIVTMSRAAG